MNETIDVAVVGAGPSGLAAAQLLKRRGRQVTVFEGSGRLGGQDQSPLLGGVPVNLGPHALYLGGDAVRVLKELGVTWDGHPPPLKGARAFVDGRLEPLPGSVWTLIATGMFGWADRFHLARALMPLLRSPEPGADPDEPLTAYLDRACGTPAVRVFVEALFRVSTYSNAPDLISAAAACRQVHLALTKNVTYFPFVALIDQLRAGLTIETGKAVRAVRPDGQLTFDDRAIQARTVVIATPLPTAVKLFDDPKLRRFHETAVPARAACLDLVLSELPNPGTKVTFGVGVPLYASVHREEPGKVVLQAARYLAPGEHGTAARASIEGLLDAVQPGWRAKVVEERFLPELSVTTSLPLARTGGKGFGVTLSDRVFAAADWASGGFLTDGGLAAAHQIAMRDAVSVRLAG